MTRTDRSPGRGPSPSGGGAPRRRPRPSGPQWTGTPGPSSSPAAVVGDVPRSHRRTRAQRPASAPATRLSG
jgi:hypothetical protein